MRARSLILLAVAAACAGSGYVRTRGLPRQSAFVRGEYDDAARAEIEKRATADCGPGGYDFGEPAQRDDGLIMCWVCSHPKVLDGFRCGESVSGPQ